MGTRRDLSIFAQRLDRAQLTAFFLGGVVPLVLLAEALRQDGHLGGLGRWSLLLGATAFLSLGAFLVLKRTARSALSRADEDNRRLSLLVSASEGLVALDDPLRASEEVAMRAGQLVRGTALVVRRAPAGLRSLASTAGSEEELRALLAGAEEAVTEALEAGSLERRWLAGDGVGGELTVLPLPGERALVVAPADGEPVCGARTAALVALRALAAGAFRAIDVHDAQRNFYSHVVELLDEAVDVHLGYHQGHGRRVAQLANHVARELGLSEERRRDLHFAALLHDIGMLRIDRSQHADREACRPHAQLGHEMLKDIELWAQAAAIVLHHHEWHDGSGYPEGLAGEDIPLESRIVATCEVYDTLTSSTSYREAVPPAEALREIEAGAGTQFDPDVVLALVSVLERAGVAEQAAVG